MKLKNRGFFSIDALVATTLLIIISSSFLNLYQARKQAAEQMGAGLEARVVGEKLAAVMNSVYANGENFELRTNLPENLGKYQYVVAFDNLSRQILVENSAWGTIAVVLPLNNVENFVLTRENLENTVRIFWSENQVRVTNV